ncbi:MFS transporter [Micrococcoides hystricis]|uniref:MFS transporter n=1 Tax=Micrococcoides hystricis TaxID=1572761 RepID=A0ABV6P9R4_9MICC
MTVQSEEPMSHKDVLRALSGILAAFFASMLALNVVMTALPVIITELDGNQTEYSWVLTAALLANAASTPIWGKLADLMDKKRLIQISIVIFMIASIVAFFATSMAMLIGARVIQGLGMGGLAALSMAIMGTIIAPRNRGRYAGYMGATMATATAAGPLIGGLVVDAFGWRWTFFIGIPFALIAMIVIARTLKLPVVRRQVQLDYLGAFLLTTAASTFLIWVSFVNNPDFFPFLSWQTFILLGVVLVAVILFIFVESRAVEPVMNLKMLTSRTTLLAVIASASVAVTMFGIPAYLGQYFQLGRGFSPTASGLMLLPMIFSNLAGSTGAGMLITKYGRWKIFLVIGTALLPATSLALSFIDEATPLWLIGVLIGLQGLGLGMVIQNFMLAVQNTVKVTEIGAASAAIAFFRTLGGATGNVVLGAVMAMQVAGVAVGTASARTLYAEGTGTLFFITMLITLPGMFATWAIKEVPLRRTV